MSFALSPLKCLTTTLFLSSDNFQPFTSFTIESPNITVTGSLFFLGILLDFLWEVARLLLLLSSICIDLSHAPSSELSFPVMMRNANIDDLDLTTHKRLSSRILEKKVSDLEYADDIGLLENEKDKAQKQLDALSIVTEEMGLVINGDKTKVLSRILNQNLKSNLMKLCLKW